MGEVHIGNILYIVAAVWHHTCVRIELASSEDVLILPFGLCVGRTCRYGCACYEDNCKGCLDHV